MCTLLADNIVTFNVAGTPVKIPTEKLSVHPESLLTTMVHNKVQPTDGFFVACCPKIFGYILRFVLYDMKVDPIAIANKLATSEAKVREVIDGFKFKGIYFSDTVSTNKKEAEELYKNIWTLAENGELDKLKLIVDQGFDLNVKCPMYGSTPLMYASQYGHLDCIMYLVDHGAKVNDGNNNGYTALHFASNGEVVKLLIKKGADVNTRSNKGLSPLHYVLLPPSYKSIKRFPTVQSNEIIRELIINGANLDLPDSVGRTPLHMAIIYSTDELVVDLLTKNCKLDAKTTDGDTLLHLASCKSLKIVKQLLELGADINVENNVGDTPVIVAAKNAKHEIVAELCKHMVNQKV
jgi:ankyrin repeat protein